jgi:hypothetical protein
VPAAGAFVVLAAALELDALLPPAVAITAAAIAPATIRPPITIAIRAKIRDR